MVNSQLLHTKNESVAVHCRRTQNYTSFWSIQKKLFLREEKENLLPNLLRYFKTLDFSRFFFAHLTRTFVWLKFACDTTTNK